VAFLQSPRALLQSALPCHRPTGARVRQRRSCPADVHALQIHHVQSCPPRLSAV
jgi:hypothetical protein